MNLCRRDELHESQIFGWIQGLAELVPPKEKVMER